MTTASASRLAAQQAALVRVEQLEAEKARLHAESLAARADLARLWEGEHAGFAEMELAGTALVGQHRAARELDDGRRARELFPHLVALLADGAVFVPAAELLLQATRACTPEVQMHVDARVSPLLVGRNVTDARRLIATTVLAVEAELDPQLTRDRLDAARKNARVWISPGTDGTTAIGAVLEALAGRRWALDFERLVHAQQVLDTREGRDRTLDEVQAEVFAHLPGLVLELTRAAADGRLPHLLADAEAAADETTRDAAADLLTLVDQLPPHDGAGSAAPGRGAAHDGSHDADPFDVEAAAVADPWRDARWHLPPEPDGPDVPEGPPPHHGAAQDAAGSDTTHRTEGTLRNLLLRCLRMPLPAPATINLHLPMATALDLTDAPGHLEGHGPVPARRVRELLPTASLREVYVDESTGVPLGTGPVHRPRPGQADLTDLLTRLRPITLTDAAQPQHDPSRRLADFVKLRDQRCSGPGCTMPASRCDLDHEVEHPEGPTAEWNLADRSRRCHQAKHAGWTAHRDPDGTTTWTSPTGRTYTSHSQWQPPPRHRRGVTFHLPPADRVVEIELD